MIYSAEQKTRLLSFPIEKVLFLCGCSTEHTKSRLYHSPLREDSNPSFQITRHNTWIDYGTGESGGLLELVRRLMNISTKDAYDWLARNSGVEYVMSEATAQSFKERESAAITICKEEDIFFTPLLNYISGRGVDLDVVRLYCRQVRYDIRDSGRLRYALAFPNNAGGWVIRGTGKGNKGGFKGCNKSWISTFDSGGRLSFDVTSEDVVVFEGFYNFLSFLQLCGVRSAGCDVCVLNSVSNAHLAYGYLGMHKTVNCCTDNDEAGTKCFNDIVRECPQSKVVDRRVYYMGHNDINDYLVFLRNHGWVSEEKRD